MTATEAPPAPVVTQPGIYGPEDLDESAYHADPVPGGSLSSTGARKLLPPSCPARFAWWRDHPEPKSEALDFGTAAHRLVLGAGMEIHVVDAPDWRTKAAREERDAVRLAGKVPLLAAEHDQVQAMAVALREHPVAGRIFAGGNGQPEQSLFHQDAASGVWLRVRLDWMFGRPIIADYKTSRSASPASFARSVAEYGYHVQQEFYRRVYEAVTGERPKFVFVVQEKEPPYLVSVCELAADDARYGAALTQHAIERYRDCTEAGIWPAYTADDSVELISLPAWAKPRGD